MKTISVSPGPDAIGRVLINVKHITWVRITEKSAEVHFVDGSKHNYVDPDSVSVIEKAMRPDDELPFPGFRTTSGGQSGVPGRPSPVV